MAVYDGFFDAVQDEETEAYDRAYTSGDFTGYFGEIIGSGVCVHDNPDSFKVRLENGAAVVSPGYLFIQGYWLKNDADYTIPLTGTGTLAIAAHLDTGKRMIELEARSMAQSYPDSLVLALVTAASNTVEDTRYNADICGIIDTAGSLSGKVEWAINYIDTEIEDKLAQAEAQINAQEAKLDAKIAEVQAVADRIAPPPIGSIKFSASQNVDEDWLKCDGSFINETDYPELVAVLGKLTPGVSSFEEVYNGVVGAGVTNAYLSGTVCWVYSAADNTLYGYSGAGTNKTIKEIPVTGADALTTSSTEPIYLSVVGGSLFLAQNHKTTASFTLLEFSSFTGTETSISLVELDVSSVLSASTYRNDVPGDYFIPEVSIKNQNKFVVCLGYVFNNTSSSNSSFHYWYFMEWTKGDFSTAVVYRYAGSTGSDGISSSAKNYVRSLFRFSRKTSMEMLFLQPTSYTASGQGYLSCKFSSEPNEVYDSTESGTVYPFMNVDSDPIRTSPVAGNGTFIYRCFLSDRKLCLRVGKYNPITLFGSSGAGLTKSDISLPSRANVFQDSVCYAASLDLWIVFLGTGIAFSQTPMDDHSWGYLDTQETLGVITQFGCLEYDETNHLLYISGQDTMNKGKLGVMKIPTLFDYANDGAWLPMIASDGVPAYIKAKGTEEPTGPTVPAQVKIVNSNSEYVSVMFNGEKLIPGTYTRQVSENEKFSIGLRLESKWSGSREYSLNLNGSAAVRISESSSIGTVVSESFNTQDYISGVITLTVTV